MVAGIGIDIGRWHPLLCSSSLCWPQQLPTDLQMLLARALYG